MKDWSQLSPEELEAERVRIIKAKDRIVDNKAKLANELPMLPRNPTPEQVILLRKLEKHARARDKLEQTLVDIRMVQVERQAKIDLKVQEQKRKKDEAEARRAKRLEALKPKRPLHEVNEELVSELAKHHKSIHPVLPAEAAKKVKKLLSERRRILKPKKKATKKKKK